MQSVLSAVFFLSVVSAAPIIDLTYTLDNETVVFSNGVRPFEVLKVKELPLEETRFRSREFAMEEHVGTHMDAPLHTHKDGRPIDEIPLDRIIGPAVVIDVRSKVGDSNLDYAVTVADIKEWETRNGEIPAGAIVLLNSGWGKRWGDPVAFRGTNSSDFNAGHWPGWSGEACEFLSTQRNVSVIGGDTISADIGQSGNFPCHRITARNDVMILENVANLDLLPEKGSRVHAIPIKLRGGTGAPARVFATIRE